MPVVVTTGASAAAAAAEQQRQEEEEMTRYTDEDLKEGWEFKIVRSVMGAFRKPEVLRQVVEEESRAGWILLEKFDDSRVRFKRPISARANDATLPPEVDPYRTRYGMHEGAFALWLTLGILAFTGALIVLIFLLVGLSQR